jgi:uridine kinase
MKRPKGKSQLKPTTLKQRLATGLSYANLIIKTNLVRAGRKIKRKKIPVKVRGSKKGIEVSFNKIKELYERKKKQGKRLVIGIGGGIGAAGKSTISKMLKEKIERELHLEVSMVALDNYFKPVTIEEYNKIEYGHFNPVLTDIELATKHISSLAEGKSIPKLEYVYANIKKGQEAQRKVVGEIHSAPIILVEGLFATMLKGVDLKIALLARPKLVLERRIKRDSKAPKFRDPAYIFDKFYQKDSPGSRKFITPKILESDIIIISTKKPVK